MSKNELKKKLNQRFTLDTALHNNNIEVVIVDNEGMDDYYYINDYDDFVALCNLLNELNDELKSALN